MSNHLFPLFLILNCLFLSLNQIIAKQLVDAVKGLEDKHIFHRDIKTENLLVETSSDVPRLRLIDFGLGCFFEKRSFYKNFYGKTYSLSSSSSFICLPMTLSFR